MKRRTLCSLAAGVLLLLSAPPALVGVAHADSAPPKILSGAIPLFVQQGRAHFLGKHDANAVITFGVEMPMRNQTALDAYLHSVSDPASPNYHQYLSQDLANQEFNPTVQQEQLVVSWLRSHGLRVVETFPNHLMVVAQGSTSQVNALFNITLNDYTGRVHGKDTTFYAPDQAPVIDSSISATVETVTGLDSFPRFRMQSNGTAHNSTPYYPQDFANAYDVNPLWNAGANGAGQHIGITLWTTPPSDATLSSWGTKTGAAVPTTANGRLHVIQIDGGTTTADTSGESGLDIEYAGGMAPGATIDYYEMPTDSSGNATGQGILDALNTAGSDSNFNRQITNSWGGCEASSASDPWTQSAENIFASNSATGHNYFFSTGDNGSWCDPSGTGSGTDPYPDYPATSPHVTAVGGTAFKANINGSYPGETAWAYCATCSGGNPEGSGGGYSNIFAQPSWQTSLGGAGKRGIPDVSAVGDPNTGAYVCWGATSQCGQFGGTSLASPAWAGMMATLNSYLALQGKSQITSADSTIYSLATHSQTYTAFHDVTSGTNGHYNAGGGWDAVTGWGSPDLYNVARDLTGAAPALSASYSVSAQPSSFVPGGTANISVTVTNTGSQTWPAGGSTPVHLGVHFATRGGGYGVSGTDATWLTNQRAALPANVAPGQSVTLQVPVTAPTSSGSYTLEYEMVQENVAWFAQYLDKTVTVSTPALGATYSAGAQPSSWAAGGTQTYSITLTNRGSQTWPAGGVTPVHLGVHFAGTGGCYGVSGTDSTWLTNQRFALPNDVAPGASVTMTIAVTAPSTTGSLTLEYQMVQENVAWFAQCLDVATPVSAATLSASYSTSGQPTSFTHGGSATYSVTVTNTGNQTWPAGGSTPVHLGIHFAAKGGGYGATGSGGPGTGLNWLTDQHLTLPSDVAPGASVTVSVTVNAPATPGTYTLEYEMVQENVAWFAQYLDASMNVT